MGKQINLRLKEDLRAKLESICVRHGDQTYHIEKALEQYPPIKESTAVAKFDALEDIGDMFDMFWSAGMRKLNRKKAKQLFTGLMRLTPINDRWEFTGNIIQDIRARLSINQLGFEAMHPTTYLNGERWTDEIRSQQDEPRKQSLCERSTATAKEIFHELETNEDCRGTVGHNDAPLWLQVDP